MIEEFIEYLKYQKNYSLNTIIGYENDIKEFKNILKKEYINITYDDVRVYLKKINEFKYTNTTINRKLSSLRSFYKYLNKKKYMNENPLSLITSVKKENKLPKFLYYEQIMNIINEIDIKNPLGQRDRLILELLYATGLRVNELVNIKLKDIGSNEIKVLGKGNKERIVIFGEYANKILNIYLNDGYIKLNKNSEYLFLNKNGKNITDRAIRQILDKYTTKSGLKTKISPHVIRHTFATHMLNEGSDLMTVQKLLGHKNLKATGIYTHVTNERLRHLYRECHPRAHKEEK